VAVHYLGKFNKDIVKAELESNKKDAVIELWADLDGTEEKAKAHKTKEVIEVRRKPAAALCVIKCGSYYSLSALY
jgi:hypothetical protein